MPSLLESQRDIGRAMGDPHVDAPACIVGADAAERLAIHRGTIIGVLVKALRLNFPTVERLVGPGFFERAASSFVQAHAAASADLNAYGDRFPDFLQEFAPCAGLPYLPDVARLDWAVARALHAPDAQPLLPDALAAYVQSADTLCFAAHPSISLVCSPFPIHEIWHAVLARDDARMAAIDLSSGPVHLIIQRLREVVEVLTVAAGEWPFTKALLAGVPLGRAMELADVDAAACLAHHLAAGRIVGFTEAHEKERS